MKSGWTSAGKAALAAALLALVLTGTEAWAKGGSGGRGGGGGRAGHSGSKSGSHHHTHRGSRHSYGASSGVSFYGSYWAFPAYWFAAAVPYLPREPVYYIERSEEELRSSSVWYYCESEAAYYPYVSRCPAGWVQVEPFALP